MQENDWVCYFYPSKAKQKLGQGWTRPHLVTHKVSNVLYQIQTSSSSRPKIVHVDNLRPYETETMPTDWQHISSTNEISCNDEFDKNECEGCASDCNISRSQPSGQNLMGTSRFGKVRRPPKQGKCGTHGTPDLFEKENGFFEIFAFETHYCILNQRFLEF